MRRRLLALVRRAAGVPRVEANVDARFGALEQRLEQRLAQHELAVRADLDRVRADGALVTRDQVNDWARRQALEFADKLETAVGELCRYADRRAAEEVAGAVLPWQGEVVELQRRLAAMQLRLDAVRAVQEHRSAPPSPASAVASLAGPAPSPVGEEIYAALEERFRGASELIEERQREYVPLVAPTITAEHPLVDLGSGRGEWLALLSAAGLPAFGVDANAVFVERSRAGGLDVRDGDLVAFLRDAPDASFGAVTLFQVVEHLPFEVLVAVLRDARRVLVPGGVLLAETPNGENLRVGATTFWLDPTHERPLHPQLLSFLAEETGFVDIELLLRHRLGPVPELGDGPLAASVGYLVDLVDGPGDVTLVARRPRS